ncbi:hypothetical protein Tco_0212571 [Tanacetum coccineum]
MWDASLATLRLERVVEEGENEYQGDGHPKSKPELAPEPDHLNMFAPHQIPQPEGNMNGWILEDDEEEEEEEEDPEMEEEIEEEDK